MFNENESNILVVDDTLANLRLLVGMLTEHGYKVRPVPNALLALSGARAIPPDLILLDINMPEMSGYEVCQQLKADEQTRDIPIIFISALNETIDKVKAFAVGGVDYITKPFQLEEVLARVRTHLALRKLQKELQQANDELEQRVAARTAELARLNTVYECFVPREFLSLLQKKTILDVKLGDQIQQELTIMFSDIRDFTTLSESMSPQDTFNFINEYLSWVSPLIRQHGGVIDKYVGDAIMALFPSQAEFALQAAIAIVEQVARFNAYRQKQGHFSIKSGVGLHTGSLMLGIIGEEQRMQGTVISDAVNLASRLEGLTKQYGVSIAISEQTLMRIEDPTKYNFRFLDKVQVKGKKEPVAVFEVFDGHPEVVMVLKLKTRSFFEEGLFLYHEKKFTAANEKFNTVLSYDPEDKAAHLYLARTTYFITHGVPPDWSGVQALTEK